MTNIKDLEQFEPQLPHYSELVMQILLRQKKEAEWLIEKLLVYLKANPTTEILSLRKISKEENHDLSFMLEVRFRCGACNQNVIEETNLMCFWGNGQTEERKPICNACREKFEEYARDAQEEEYRQKKAEEEDREKEEELKAFPVIEEHEQKNNESKSQKSAE